MFYIRLGLLVIQLSVLTRLSEVGAIQSISSTSIAERFESCPPGSITGRPTDHCQKHNELQVNAISARRVELRVI